MSGRLGLARFGTLILGSDETETESEAVGFTVTGQYVPEIEVVGRYDPEGQMAILGTIGGNGALFIGEDKPFLIEVLDVAGLPVNIAGWTIVLDVRLTDYSPTAIIARIATITGVFNAVRTVNTQRARVAVTDTEMGQFRPRTHRHTWKRMDEGLETVLHWGDFKPQKPSAP